MYFKGRTCILDVRVVKELILKDFHEIAIVGHLGFEKTYESVRKNFYWLRIKTMVRDYVLGCSACQRTKSKRVMKA